MRGLHDYLTQDRAGRFRKLHMHGGLLKKCSGPPHRSIDGLIDQHQILRFYGLIQAAYCTRGDDPTTPEGFKSEDIGPIRYLRWIQQMAHAMPRENSNWHAVPITEDRRSGWTTKRRFHLHRFASAGSSEQISQARATNDSDPILHLQDILQNDRCHRIHRPR